MCNCYVATGLLQMCGEKQTVLKQKMHNMFSFYWRLGVRAQRGIYASWLTGYLEQSDGHSSNHSKLTCWINVLRFVFGRGGGHVWHISMTKHFPSVRYFTTNWWIDTLYCTRGQMCLGLYTRRQTENKECIKNTHLRPLLLLKSLTDTSTTGDPKRFRLWDGTDSLPLFQ